MYIIGIKENTEKLTLDEVVDLLPPPASRGVQLEGPQEVGRVLEVGADGEDLDKKRLCMNQSVSEGITFSVNVSEKIKPLILLSKGCIKSLSSGKKNTKNQMGQLITSWMRSSTQMMPNLPRVPSTRSLEVIAVRLPLI